MENVKFKGQKLNQEVEILVTVFVGKRENNIFMPDSHQQFSLW